MVWHNDTAPDSASCQFDIAIHYNSDAVAPVSCSATWNSDGTTTVNESYTLHVETSSPSVSATPARPPDSNGWYNHAVSFSFSGSSFSGIASCTAPTTYSGPDSTSATVSGSCTDNAGKTASATSAVFQYDASALRIKADAAAGDGVVTLLWGTAGDIAPLASVEIIRAPGRNHLASSVLYRSNGSAYNDTKVRNGVKYRYTIVATDQAGNTSTYSLTVVPGPHLLAPAAGAHVTTPPQLQWTPVRHATYYNVQLYRGDRKLLSMWPSHARLQLKRTWHFGGHLWRFKRGKYRWYVWPGYGRRSAARYGSRVGTGTFVVRSAKSAAAANVVYTAIRMLARDASR